jgi:opacity protein-like surface antigen
MRKILAVLFLAGSASAWAQTAEVWFNAGESITSSSLGTDVPCTTSALCASIGATPNDIQFTNGFRFSFRFTLNQGDHFGHEVQYAYNRTSLRFNPGPINGPTAQSLGMAFHQGSYNFLYYLTKDDSRIRPFGTAGVGFTNYVLPGSSAASGGGSTKLGFNYGVGVKVKVRGPWAARLDFRQYTTPKPFGNVFALENGWVVQEEVSAGVGYTF